MGRICDAGGSSVKAEPARPYTPEQLAVRWDCSAETVRAMIRSGSLPAFRVGGKLLRIARQTVEDFECGTIGSGDSRDVSSSCGTTTTARGADIALRHTRPRKPNAKPATSS
ncbi:helix-turn-helix domain-containing protein [Chachezhania antarctica]|uniref:helix-turn-helix domain-containing protein n=1 Tax=Chachezhania antarctica TaxID=2340860 RepID=UPI000EADB2FE